MTELPADFAPTVGPIIVFDATGRHATALPGGDAILVMNDGSEEIVATTRPDLPPHIAETSIPAGCWSVFSRSSSGGEILLHARSNGGVKLRLYGGSFR